MENRRQFTRILFLIKATLTVDEQAYPVSIHDISLSGALVTSPVTELLLLNKNAILSFSLGHGNAEVSMNVDIVHQEFDETGLKCKTIDIDSITHLRRLVELNLGDENQLNKELSQLSRITAEQ
jgi:hypothetical protein